jgi:hypothetical protein
VGVSWRETYLSHSVGIVTIHKRSSSGAVSGVRGHDLSGVDSPIGIAGSRNASHKGGGDSSDSEMHRELRNADRACVDSSIEFEKWWIVRFESE